MTITETWNTCIPRFIKSCNEKTSVDQSHFLIWKLAAICVEGTRRLKEEGKKVCLEEKREGKENV